MQVLIEWQQLLAGVALLIGTRVLPRLLFAPSYNSDTYYHLTLARLVKKRGWQEATRVRPLAPLGFHWLFARLPVAWWRAMEVCNGAIFDALHVSLFVVFVYWVFPAVEVNHVCWASFLLLSSPGWLYVGAGPRTYHFTERVASEFLVSAAMCLVCLHLATTSYIAMFGAIVTGAFVLVTSKFGAQVLLFFCIGVAALSNSVSVLLAPLGAIVLAQVLSGGAYWNVLKGQVKHLGWYYRMVSEGRLSVAERNRWGNLSKRFSAGGLSGLAGHLFLGGYNSYGVGIYHHIHLLIAGGWLAVTGGMGGIPYYIVYWLVTGVALWLLTSNRPFLFLGEAERYLFAIAVPAYLVVAVSIKEGPSWLPWGLLAYQLGAWIVAIWCLRRTHRRTTNRERDARTDMISFIQQLKPMRFISVDFSPMWDVAYESHHEHFMINPEYGISVRHDDVFEHYPIPRWEAVEKLGIRLLIVSKKAFDHARDSGIQVGFPLHRLETLYRNELYSVYQIPAEAASA